MMDDGYDWEMARNNALQKLGELQRANLGDVYEYLLEAAATIADVLCMKEQRFSILELISISGSRSYDAYKIIFSNPFESEDSLRHGASEIGMLHKPNDKLALLEAINSEWVVVANNVAENPLTQYIGAHVENKKLKHMAIIPLPGYLLIFDRVVCGEAFNDQESRFLKEARRIVKFGFGRHVKEREGGEIVDVFKGALSHRIKNPMMIMGGFQRRLEEALSRSDYEKALAYVEIIAQAGKRLSEDLVLFREVKGLFLDSRNEANKMVRELSEYLNIFRREEFCLDENLFQKKFILNQPQKMTHQLFSRIKSFMLGNKRDHDLGIKLVSFEDQSITICFISSGFRKAKNEVDESLFLVRWIVEILGGKTELSDDFLFVTLPGNIEAEKEGH